MDIDYGLCLTVDLSSRTSRAERLDEGLLRSFIGGGGVATRLLARHLEPGTDALDPANPLVFALGPFCGTSVPTSGRHHLVSLSPLTGLYAESDVGGAWGSAFRATGFDFLVILGASPSPVSLIVTQEGAAFEDAAALWGEDTFRTFDAYRERWPRAETACIGPAGERLVRIACVAHDGAHARMAGRCGLGAVMGSKRLKAVVAVPREGGSRRVHDPAGLSEETSALARRMPVNAESMAEFGTGGSLEGEYAMGDIPIRNWALGTADIDLGKISGRSLAASGLLRKRFHCAKCPIGCGRTIELADGRLGGGAEYETLCLFGSNLLIDDMEAIQRANEAANRLGIDTISSGGAIGFLMEAYERGETRGADLSGVVPAWGSAEALMRLVELIGRREGIGALLGEGVARASRVIGSPEYAVHVKGLELPAHDPRAFNGMGLSYATGNRGACHLQGMTFAFESWVSLPERGFDAPQDRFGTSGKPELVTATQDFMSAMDSLKLCKFALFAGVDATAAARWLALATGWDIGADELLRAGERIFTLKRMINCERGADRKDDTLPDRIRFEPRGGGAGVNLPPDLDASLDRYYQCRGWTEDGIPTEATVSRLGLLGIIPR